MATKVSSLNNDFCIGADSVIDLENNIFKIQKNILFWKY